MSAQIQEVLLKMRHGYIENLPQQLDNMETLVMQLKRGEDYAACFEALYLAVHSLKGTAGTYGVQIITAICHPFEDYLTAEPEGGSVASNQQIRTCLQFTHLLRKAHKLVSAGSESFPEIEVSLAALQEHCQHV